MPGPAEDDVDLMRLAVEAAASSPNRSRKTGAALRALDGTVIVGCNDFAPGVRDLDERHEGEERYAWIEHAERAVVAKAARAGVATEGATMALPWYPCDLCANMIVGAGISRLVCTHGDEADPRWGATFVRARKILQEGGVDVETVDKDAVSVRSFAR